MEKKNRPSSGADDVPIKPIQRRKTRKKPTNMADIVNKIMDKKRKEMEERQQQEFADTRQSPEEEQRGEEQNQRYQQNQQEDAQPQRNARNNESQHAEWQQTKPDTPNAILSNSRQQSARGQSPEYDGSSPPLNSQQQPRRHSLSPYGHPLPKIDSSPEHFREVSPQSSPPPPVFNPLPFKKNKDVSIVDNEESTHGKRVHIAANAQTPGPVNDTNADYMRHAQQTSTRDNNQRRDQAAALSPVNAANRCPSVNGDDWQSGMSVTESNRHMLINEINCDVTFLVGEMQEEEAIMAHSYVLMARSSRFFRLLTKDAAMTNKLYSLTDVHPNAFRDLLMYIYTDNVDLNMKTASNLLPLAHKFSIGTLKKECFRVVLSEMGSENVCSILERAHIYEDAEVYEKCSKFILFTAKDVLKEDNFKQLCKTCLDEIVSSDDLNADEVSVFYALLNWSKSDCSKRKLLPNDENKRKVLGDTLFLVRFCLMDVREFTKHVSRKEILLPDEKIALYQYFHGETDKLPTKFHHSKLRRFGRNKEVYDKEEYLNKPKYNDNASGSWQQHSTDKSDSWQQHTTGKSDRWKQKKAIKFESPTNVPTIQTPPHSLSRVSRFCGAEGSWQVKSPDAISFRATASIYLHGVQVYGPTQQSATYIVYMTVFNDLKNAVCEDCRTVTIHRKDVCDIVLPEPVLVPEDRLFTVETRMRGDQPTLRGIGGAKKVSAEGVMFYFIDSSKSLNGTDVTTGQIPSLLFKKLYN